MTVMDATMVNNTNAQVVVMKFGGTSVGSQKALVQVIKIISEAQRKWGSVVVVVSAISGVTNHLLEAAQMAKAGDDSQINNSANAIRQAHSDLILALIPDRDDQQKLIQTLEKFITEFIDRCKAVYVLSEISPKALDKIVSLGERMSIQLVSAVLNYSGVDAKPVEATDLIVTNAVHQNAYPNMVATEEKTQAVLQPICASGSVPIITGFIGATPEGVTTTLGRGGSDFSATIIGRAISADEIWIWTDVTGVMTADPRIVPDAQTLSTLSYREVSELAYFGAKVLHPKAIRPLVDLKIPVHVCNTFAPDDAGTRIVADSQIDENGFMKAVTVVKEQCLITIEGRGMLGVPGVAARVFSTVAELDTSVSLISQASSEQSICFSISISTADEVVSALNMAFSKELENRDVESVWATDEVVIVTVVGAGMQHTPGVAGKVFGVLGDCEINVIAIAQGSSEVSISLVVDENDAEQAVRALHQLILKKAKK